MQQYRAVFDAAVTFTDGGDLRARGFGMDVPRLDPTEPELTALFLAVLGRPAVERVELTGVRVFAEPGRELPDRTAPRLRYAELSHVIEGDTATRLYAPRHRYEGGTDLAGLSLERLAELPAVVVRATGGAVGVADLEPLVVAGHAVLLHNAGPVRTAAALTGEAAALLVERGAALIGTDSASLDDPAAADRPAHTVLLAADIPIVEHLTGLGDLPPTGARFTAAPPRIVAAGSAPVRAFATLPWFEPHDHQRSAGWQPARP